MIIREYPPKAFDSFTHPNTNTGEILDIDPVNYIKETMTLNTDGITWGSGEYKIYSSSTTSDRYKRKLFDRINNLAGWGFNYDVSTGYYAQGRTSYIKNDYLGDWLIIELQLPIFLKRFSFLFNNITRVPGLWRCYGSNDGVSFTEINEASNDVSAKTCTFGHVP